MGSFGNVASMTVDTMQRFRIYCLVDGMFEERGGDEVLGEIGVDSLF
jgi:hypothetical protein